jgi:nucleoside-diphosphate-sugar epimerase
MSDPSTILITGAAGFIGRHTVAAARRHGHAVHALVRSEASKPANWADDPMITSFATDLALPGAVDVLGDALNGVTTVIHIAASLTGDTTGQARDTLQATDSLLAALTGRAGKMPRLVLVSSLAVYDTSKVPRGGMLDENTPLETRPDHRDAYCRAKLVQEQAVRGAAQKHGFELRIMRPGAVFGPGRLWNGHLGLAFGGVVVRLGAGGEVPCSFVGHCAEALVLAAERPFEQSGGAARSAKGRVEVVNVVDDDLPSRARYLNVLRTSGWPRFVIPGSWRLLAAFASVLSVTGRHGQKLPGLLRPAVVEARLKPITYSNARLHDLLGWQPDLTFEKAMAHDR